MIIKIIKIRVIIDFDDTLIITAFNFLYCL